jgi:hypothetical protein
MTELRKKDLRAVAKYAAVFSAPGFSPGEWQGATYFKLAPELHDFLHAAYEITPKDFDWPSWAAVGREIEADQRKLAAADLETIRRLLLVHVRTERFCEGHLAAAIEDGRLVRVLQRLGELAA